MNKLFFKYGLYSGLALSIILGLSFYLLLLKTPTMELSRINLTDINGNLIDQKTLLEKPLVINYWATWCKPCIEFFPYLHVIYDKYKDDKDVMFVILNTASANTFEDAFTWVDQNKQFPFPFYYNEDKKLSAKLDVNTIPTTFLLDKNSKIRFKKIGNEGEKAMPQLDAMIEFLKQQK